jgi:hypothetical protein
MKSVGMFLSVINAMHVAVEGPIHMTNTVVETTHEFFWVFSFL